MGDYEFGNVDFNWLESSNYGSILVGQRMGGAELRLQMSQFSGVDGAWSKNLGKNPVPVQWVIDVGFEAQSDQNTFEALLVDAHDGTNYTLTHRGTDYDETQLVDWQPAAPKVPSLLSPWAFRQSYVLTFMIMDPP